MFPLLHDCIKELWFVYHHTTSLTGQVSSHRHIRTYIYTLGGLPQGISNFNFEMPQHFLVAASIDPYSIEDVVSAKVKHNPVVGPWHSPVSREVSIDQISAGMGRCVQAAVISVILQPG